MFCITVALSCVLFFVSASALPEFNDDRVINGKDASILDFPHQASLQKLERHACGCSILNNKVLVTAAHCLDGATQSDINHMTVRAGTSEWESGGVLKKVDKILIHPSYEQKSMINDIAVIKLSTPLTFSNKIQPIKLATKQPADNSKVVISGWGYKSETEREMSDKLQETTVKYISGKACSSSLYKYLGEIKDGMVCGVGETNDACQGDSGGPLIDAVTRDLVGVVSWGYGCAQKGYPGIYSDVVYFTPWINKAAAAI